MEHSEPILDQQKRAEIVRGIAPYLERAGAIHASNSEENVKQIENLYRNKLRGYGIPKERVDSMPLIELLKELDTFDRSHEIVGESNE